nr:G-box-binding factor 4-like [Tanacetum cinerariifolium]
MNFESLTFEASLLDSLRKMPVDPAFAVDFQSCVDIDLQKQQQQLLHISDHKNNNNNDTLISMNMDDILKTIYDQPPTDGDVTNDPEMTLEDFLTKAGAVREEDVVVKLPPVEYPGEVVVYQVGGGGYGGGGGVGTRGRGKRKVVVDDVVIDKATQQKQRRMIKNRESAARSRERKQAYTVELESLVTQLEEEHTKLLKEVDELNKQRLKQVAIDLIPGLGRANFGHPSYCNKDNLLMGEAEEDGVEDENQLEDFEIVAADYMLKFLMSVVETKGTQPHGVDRVNSVNTELTWCDALDRFELARQMMLDVIVLLNSFHDVALQDSVNQELPLGREESFVESSNHFVRTYFEEVGFLPELVFESSSNGNNLHWQWELILPVGTFSWQWECLVHFIPNIQFPQQKNTMIPQVHYPQLYSPMYLPPHPSQPQISHLSILPSQQYQSHQTLSTPIAYNTPQSLTQPLTEFPQMDLSVAVTVFNQRDNLITCFNKAMTFLTSVASSRVNVQQVQGRQGQSYAGNNYKGNATSLGGLMQEAGKAFPIDPGIPDGKAAKTTILNTAAFQTEDLDTYESDCNDVSNAKAVLMANLSNYGSDIILEEKVNQEKNIESLTAKLERYKERVKTFKQRLNIDLRTREKMIDSQMDDMIKEKLALKQQIDSLKQNLSNQIKEKESLLQTFTVFKNESKEKKNIDFGRSKSIKNACKKNDLMSKEKKVNTTLINYVELNRLSGDFGKHFVLQQELSDEQTFWLQTSHPNTEQSASSPVKIEAPRELPKDMHVEMQKSESCVKCLDLDVELLKSKNTYNDLSKSYSQLEKHCISLELTMQLNQEIFQKDSLRTYQINEKNDKEEKVEHEADKIKTINIELEHNVAKLLYENERLHKEIEHLKKIYKDEFDSTKKTHALSKEHCDSLIAQLNPKSKKNADLKGLKCSTSTCRSHPTSNKKNDRISQTPSTNRKNKTKSWLWHRRLSHLNFGTLNKLAKDGLARGIPKLKFQKDHLCLACALGKSKKSSYKPKAEDTKQEKVYLLHMDLCGLMRVESINDKNYILVIVDDYF